MFDYDEKRCSQCGEDIYWDEDYAVNGESVCRCCYWKSLEPTFTYENALKVGENHKEIVEINGFLWDLIRRNVNEIEDLIKREWFSGTEKIDVEDYAQAVFGIDEWENELDQAEKPKYELPFAKQTKEDLERLTIK